jgi:hypothetical protein
MPARRAQKQGHKLKGYSASRTASKEAHPRVPRARVNFTFPVLCDLVFLACEKEPWRAEHGQVINTWEEIASTLNERFGLNPPAKDSTIRNKITALRKMQEVSYPNE